MDVKYSRTRIRKVEQHVKDWLEFREDQYEEEDELLCAMKEINQRRNKWKISKEEWFSIWMLGRVWMRKKMDNFEYQALKNMIKKGEEM